MGTDVYFAARTFGQIFVKWNDSEDNDKLRFEILQKKVEKLILETKEILSLKKMADKLEILQEDSS